LFFSGCLLLADGFLGLSADGSQKLIAVACLLDL